MKKRFWLKDALVATGLAGLVALLTASTAREGNAEARVRVRGKCNSCHKQAGEEWKGSPHQTAWTNPTFAKLSADHATAACLGCHAPDSLQGTGVGKEPVVRDSVQDSGVDCAGCHQDADSKIHGTSGLKSQDHDVVTDAKLGTVEMCGSCHAKYGTVEELKATKHANDQKACVTCHMPEAQRPLVDDGAARKAHGHSFRSKDNAELLKKGLALEVKAEGGKLVVTLTSKEVGHKVPTGYDTKQVVLEVTLGDLQKTAILTKNGDGGDTRLAPGATFTLEVPTEGKKGKATVRVLHKPAPDASAEETKVMLTAEADV
jgi:nitrate/TMAO reductase-like tetraheme cytochrome c subunit